MNIFWFLDKQFDIAFDRGAFLEVIKYLQKNNKVILITGYKKNKIQSDELINKIIYIDFSKDPFLNRVVFYYNQLRSLNRLKNIYKPEILLLNTHNYFLLRKVKKLKKEFGYKAFLDIRTLPVCSSKLRNLIETILFKISLKISSKHLDGISYITEEMKKYCEEEYKLTKHKSDIWTSGVNTDLFRPSKNKKENKKFRLIYHGSIADNRGIDKTIKALDILKNENIELILLGNDNGLTKLKDLTKKLKLENKISFHSGISYGEVPLFISGADVGILPFPNWPGWNISSPIKLFEYLSCGLPVVVTKIPAHFNLLRGKDFAFWAEKSEGEELALAIKSAYTKRDELVKLGKDARQFVKENYSWTKQAEKLEKFLKA